MVEDEQESDWIKLLNGELNPEETSLLVQQGIDELHNFLESHSRAEERVLTLLGRRLGDAMGADTWDIMHDSLRQYLGEDLAYMLYWVVGVEDPRVSRLDELPEETSSDVMSFLSAVVGIYGEDLSNAYAVWNRDPENWRAITRQIYFDELRQEYYIRLSVIKYNGQEMIIEGPPDSVLSLCTALIETALMIGTTDVPVGFNPDNIKDYIEQSGELTKRLEEEQRQVSAEQANLDDSDS